MKVPIVILALTSLSLFAKSGADALLNTVGEDKKEEKKVESKQPTTQSTQSLSEFKQEFSLKDPFVMQLFSTWQAQSHLPFEVNQWVIRILKEDYKGAMHLWSAIQLKIPGNFRLAAQSAKTYLLWKLNLPQTFFDSWVDQLGQADYLHSKFSNSFEQTILTGFDEWLVKSALFVSPQQENTLQKIDLARSPIFVTLQAWVGLRRGTQKQSLLEKMQASHILKVPLSQTVALSYAKRNDLGNSGKILKRHLEPAIEATNNPKLLAEHYLQVARLLFQAGNLEAAEAYYEKVPNNVPEYLAAREELTWVWLRQGNMPKLRGEIATLNSGLFDKVFAPEVPLVRAVSNLKLCYYDAVESDIQKFVQTNSKWAKEIEEGLKSEDPNAPPKKDYFTIIAENSLQKKQTEMNEVNRLLEDSVQAVLPAVGPQSHWVVARDQLNKKLELAKQSKSEEYRRQWKNMQHALTEGIRKMQFVKVELLTQVKLYGGSTQTLTQKALKVEDVKELQDPQNMTFKFDGVIWPDELFQMRGIAQAKCLGMK